MKAIAIAVLGLSLSVGAVHAAEELTVEQATAIVAPFYGLFNVADGGDVKAVHEQVYTEDFQSCSGYLPADCWDRDTSIQVISGFAQAIPDLSFEFKEVLVSGDRIIVRGEATGTPAGELFGAPHTGKSFDMMSIDILTVRDGKISQTYHLENWLGALAQLSAQ
jgi:predicted ester cyclase